MARRRHASPYVGLEPYEEEDAQFFFGRDRERQIITANLLASRLTLLYGVSGVGKSSVLRAGVAHHLTELARANLAEGSTPEFVPVVFSSWQDDPVATLIDQVRKTTHALSPGVDNQPVPSGFTDALQACATRIDARLLIILDQFEEYLLYHERENGGGTFATELPRALEHANLRASFLISIREDALARLDRFKGSIPCLFDNYLRINHLKRADAKAAIVEPVRQFNALQGTNGDGVTIEGTLVEAVLNQVKTGQVTVGASGEGVVQEQRDAMPEKRIETPYLQLVMTRLWDQEIRHAREHGTAPVLRYATLEQLGGAERIVRTHLDAAMEALSTPEREAAVKVFRHLVTSSGAKIAHTASDLADYADLPPAVVGPMLDRLSRHDTRILRPVAPRPGRSPEQRYEICHDVLAPAVLDWRTRYAARAAERKKRLSRVRALGALLGSGALGLLLWNFQTLRQSKNEYSAFSLSAAAGENIAIDPERSLLLGLQAASLLGSNERAVMFVENVLDRALQASRARFTLPTGSANGVAFSPDGTRLAVAGVDSLVVLYDAYSGRALDTLRGHEGEVRDVAFSPSGQQLATAGGDGTARVWNIRTGDQLRLLDRHTGAVARVAFSRDGGLIGTTSWDSTARLWDASTGLERLKPLRHPGEVHGVAFGPDSLFATSDAAGRARIWNRNNGDSVRAFSHSRHATEVYALAYSPDGRFLATGGRDGVAKVWNVFLEREHLSITDHTNTVQRVAFSPDGRRLLTTSSDLTAKVWDLDTKKELFTLSGHRSTVVGAAFSPDGNLIATGSWDGTTRVWDASPGGGRDLLTVPTEGTVTGVAISPDRQRLVTTSWDGPVVVRDGLTGLALRQLRAPDNAFSYAAAYHPDNVRVAAGFSDGAVRIWNTIKADSVAIFQGHHGRVFSVAFSPNGATLASAGEDSLALLWDVATGRAVDTLVGHKDRVNAVAFSPDGAQLATASWDQTVRLWDVGSGEESRTLEGHVGWVTDVAFSPDGKHLASASADGTVRVWDPGSGMLQHTLSGHIGTVWSVGFSPDSNRLATTSYDETVRLWDAKSWRPLRTLIGHAGHVYALAFTATGDRLVTGGADSTIRILPMFSRDLSKAAWFRITRPLRTEECAEFLRKGKCPDSPAEQIIRAKEQARAGDVDGAAETLKGATVTHSALEFDPDVEARRLTAQAWVDRARGFSAVSELDSVGAAFQEARRIDPYTARTGASQVVGLGERLARVGKIEDAARAFEMAGQLNSDIVIGPLSWNTLCWYGGLNQKEQLVVTACERAVEADSTNGAIRDSRGLVRALRGDLPGAREDFKAFVDWAADGELKSRRERWIRAIDAGKNPITEEEIRELFFE